MKTRTLYFNKKYKYKLKKQVSFIDFHKDLKKISQQVLATLLSGNLTTSSSHELSRNMRLSQQCRQQRRGVVRQALA